MYIFYDLVTPLLVVFSREDFVRLQHSTRKNSQRIYIEWFKVYSRECEKTNLCCSHSKRETQILEIIV